MQDVSILLLASFLPSSWSLCKVCIRGMCRTATSEHPSSSSSSFFTSSLSLHPYLSIIAPPLVPQPPAEGNAKQTKDHSTFTATHSTLLPDFALLFWTLDDNDQPCHDSTTLVYLFLIHSLSSIFIVTDSFWHFPYVQRINNTHVHSFPVFVLANSGTQ